MAEAASISPWRKSTERIFSVDSVVPASVASPGPFPCSVTDHEKQTILCFSPHFFSLFCLPVGVYSADAFGIFPKSRTAGIQTCAVSCYSLSLAFLEEKKGIKTPTTLNTRSGPVSHGSLANTQKCILLSGISLTANMCSCLLVLKWYVIMNFPVEMGMS